jgi:hypothetical protein
MVRISTVVRQANFARFFDHGQIVIYVLLAEPPSAKTAGPASAGVVINGLVDQRRDLGNRFSQHPVS